MWKWKQNPRFSDGVSGIVTLVSPLQPLNAYSPIVVTESGIVTFPFLLPEKTNQSAAYLIIQCSIDRLILEF